MFWQCQIEFCCFSPPPPSFPHHPALSSVLNTSMPVCPSVCSCLHLAVTKLSASSLSTLSLPNPALRINAVAVSTSNGGNSPRGDRGMLDFKPNEMAISSTHPNPAKHLIYRFVPATGSASVYLSVLEDYRFELWSIKSSQRTL